jgi:predicted Fe-Mo cluster-binding NifX family protein
MTLSNKKERGGEMVKSRIIIPTAEDKGLSSELAEHFGRAPYFTVIDLDAEGEVLSVKAVVNSGEDVGGTRLTHDNILELKPNAIIVCGMGPRGIMSFQNAGVAVFKANADNLEEIITAYKENSLDGLAEGCHEAHHR